MRQLIPVILLAALPVFAQQGNLQPLPAVPPPPPGMEAFDATLEPQVTIVKTESETREEYRQNGKLYMIKVTPAFGPDYYLVDQQGDGNFIQQDGPSANLTPATWKVYSW